MTEIIQLDWDSQFFKLKIGKLVVEKTDQTKFQLLSREIKNQGFDLVYLFSKDRINGIDFVDRKRVYSSYPTAIVSYESSIKDYRINSDLLYELSYQAGHKSRFRTDPNIPEGDFKRMYRSWIDNSLNGRLADYVKVYVDEGLPVGLITAKKESDKISIGLIAVDKESRGRGIGKKLISSIMNIAAEKNLPIEVATQADNTGACKFYEQMGFTIKEESYIYHIWNK